MSERLAGFAPVINHATHTLFLGSFPGVMSLQKTEYYGFPKNQFWRLLSAIFGMDFTRMSYSEKTRTLLSLGLGLWDVYQACERQGSLDSAIRSAEMNDFTQLKNTYPNVQKLCLNGKTAGKMQGHLILSGFQVVQLPSSSPAYAQMSFDEKLRLWELAVK